MNAVRTRHSRLRSFAPAFVLALATLSGGCAEARPVARGSYSVDDDDPTSAPTAPAYQPAPAPPGYYAAPVYYLAVPQGAPARVIIAAPPPAAPQQPFTPQDSPLLAMNSPQPHGRATDTIDPLLAPKPAPPRTVYIDNGSAAPYVYPPYPYYGYAPYYGYRPYGFGLGVGFSHGHHGHHHSRHHH